jgi:hypothetical protein
MREASGDSYPHVHFIHWQEDYSSEFEWLDWEEEEQEKKRKAKPRAPKK